MKNDRKKSQLFPAELQLLIGILHSDKDNIRINSDINLNSIDWSVFLALVTKRHRLTGQIYNNLISFFPSLLPNEVFSKLKFEYNKQCAATMRQTIELLRLLDLFNQNEIKALPFKGIGLGMTMYNTVLTRGSNDLDIMIPMEAIPRANRLLIEAGYKRIDPPYDLSEQQFQAMIRLGKHFIFKTPKRNVRVELHWKFVDEDICSLPFEQIWNNRKNLTIGERIIPSCSLEDTLIILLIHGAVHNWRRLFWLNDIRIILNMLSKQEECSVVSKIRALGIERLTAASLLTLETVFSTTIPKWALKSGKEGKKIQYLSNLSVARILDSEEIFMKKGFSPSHVEAILNRVFLVPTLSYKVKCILGKGMLRTEFRYLYVLDYFIKRIFSKPPPQQ